MIKLVSLILLALSFGCSSGSDSPVGAVADLGSGGSSSSSTTKKSSSSYNQEIKPGADGVSLINQVTLSLDYVNSDGLKSFSKDIRANTSQAGTLTVEEVLRPTCSPGSNIQTTYTLFKKEKVYRDVEKDTQIKTLAAKEVFYLESYSQYFVRADIAVQGSCTAFTLVVVSKLQSAAL